MMYHFITRKIMYPFTCLVRFLWKVFFWPFKSITWSLIFGIGINYCYYGVYDQPFAFGTKWYLFMPHMFLSIFFFGSVAIKLMEWEKRPSKSFIFFDHWHNFDREPMITGVLCRGLAKFCVDSCRKEEDKEYKHFYFFHELIKCFTIEIKTLPCPILVAKGCDYVKSYSPFDREIWRKEIWF